MLEFRDVTVDPTTGSFTLRIVVPNPEHLLLPGMFVRAVVQEGIAEQAILVPQQGVSRTPKGEPIALVVDEAGTVQQRMLTLNRAIGDQWLVSSGLSAGDRVVVEGMLNVRPGAAVKAVPLNSPRPARKPRIQTSRPYNPNNGGLSMLSNFFLDRPVFAWVIAIIMMLAGGLAIYNLPISQYPPIAPPSIAIDAFYPGASAQTVEDSVIQIIEQKMTGFDKLLYMSGTSDASGAGRIELTFAPGTDPGPGLGTGAEQASARHGELARGGPKRRVSRSASPPGTGSSLWV